MTLLQLATTIIVVLFFATLVLVLVLNSRRKSSKIGTGKQKKIGGKTWNWVVPVFLISALIFGFWITSKNTKKEGGEIKKIILKQASFSWKKKPHQYGYDPKQRFGGPYDVVITKDDDPEVIDPSFCFTVKHNKGDARFYGKKKKSGIIEGWWEQKNPRSGGKWTLKKNSNDPNLYEGNLTDQYLLDGVDTELRLKY